MVPDVDPKISNRDIFLRAIQISDPKQRREFVQNACSGSLARIEKIQRMIAADARELKSPFDILVESASPSPSQAMDITTSQKHAIVEAASEVSEAGVGDEIEGYKLLQKIGEGGFGVVFMAQQTQPVRRKVALKIIKPGMDSKEVIARFEAERQSLAMMDHPNVAKVLDGGTTQTGHPFFVMELIHGTNITEFCDENRLPNRDRLALFIDACRAVQHAHMKGIIHRDLKPSNVLVTMNDDKPMPKVIDFGVSRALSQPLTERTLITAFGQMIGTPLYMSPEQAQLSANDVDIRSDIYSLGVLLYEMLTGSTPFDRDTLNQSGFDEMRRIIREVDPPRPSYRISTLRAEAITTVAHHRRTDTRKLGKSLQGEVDWIVMKALEKDRTRRYESAGDFADDVARFLSDEPVLACPPTALYRAKKLFQRHRIAAAFGSILLSVILLATFTLSWQAIQVRESEAIAKAVNQFLVEDILSQASPEMQPDRELKLRTALDRAERSLGDRFQSQPLIEASIRETIASTYFGLGIYADAEQQYLKAIAIREREQHPRHPDVLQAQHDLVKVLSSLDRKTEAYQLVSTVLQDRCDVLGESDPETIKTRINYLRMKARIEDPARAEEELRRLLPECKRRFGEQSQVVTSCLDVIALTLHAQGKYVEALEAHQELYQITLTEKGEAHPETLAELKNVAMGTMRVSPSEAIQLYERAVSLSKSALGEGHPGTLQSQEGLATAYEAAGRSEDAKRLFLDVLDNCEQYLGNNNEIAARCANNLGNLIQSEGDRSGNPEKYREARQYYERAAATLGRINGVDSVQAMMAKGNVAITLKKLGKPKDALLVEREIVTAFKNKLGDSHTATMSVQLNLALTLSNVGEHAHAVNVLTELVEDARDSEHRGILVQALINLGACQYECGVIVKAIETTREAVRIGRVDLRADDPRTLDAIRNLASLLREDPETRPEAIELWEELLPIYANTYGENGELTRFVRESLEEDRQELDSNSD